MQKTLQNYRHLGKLHFSDVDTCWLAPWQSHQGHQTPPSMASRFDYNEY
jgi:hypothetical protein